MMTKSSILLAAALPLTAAFAPSSLPGLKGLSRAPLAARSTRAPAARAGGIAMEWEKKSPEEVQKMMQANPDMIYWDVRSDDEYAKARIPDSANCAAFVIDEEGPMPMQSTFMTLMKMQNPDKSAPIVVGCASGKRSSVACAWLEAEGFDNIVELESGFNGWEAAGLPVEKD